MRIILRERENLLRFSRTIGRRSWILFGYMGYVLERDESNMSYVDKDEGRLILSVQGIFDGYNQTYDTRRDFSNDY